MAISWPRQLGQCSIGRTFTISPVPDESDDPEAAAAEFPLRAGRGCPVLKRLLWSRQIELSGDRTQSEAVVQFSGMAGCNAAEGAGGERLLSGGPVS